MMEQSKRLVLENLEGRVVRQYQWDSEKASLVYRKDTRRLEVHPDIEDLDQRGINYILMDSFTREQISQKPKEIVGCGRLKLVETIKECDSNHNWQDEEGRKNWWQGLAFSSLAIGGLLAISLNFYEEKELASKVPIEHVVQVIQQASPTKKTEVVSKPVVVAPRRAVNLGDTIGSNSGAGGSKQGEGKGRRGGSGGGIQRMGALGVLGNLNSKGKPSGGINLGAVKTSPGPGPGGGTASSGGVQTTLYGKGILAAPLGGGGNIYGSGGTGSDGYGSTGKGGGQDGSGAIALYGANGDGTSSYGTKGKGGGLDGYGENTLVGVGGGDSLPLGREAIIQGGLDGEMISAVIQKNMGQVRFCYEQGLQSDPKLSGRVAISFTIASNGQVKGADLGSTTLNSRIVEDCILRRLRSWKFPVPEGGVEVKVSYPFLLRRAGRG